MVFDLSLNTKFNSVNVAELVYQIVANCWQPQIGRWKCSQKTVVQSCA